MINCSNYPYTGIASYSMTLTLDNISPEYIISKVSQILNISTKDMVSSCRKREIVEARQIAMYFIRKYTKTSLKKIGQMFGDRDHSTVIYSCQTVQDLIDTDKKFKILISRINLVFYGKTI